MKLTRMKWNPEDDGSVWMMTIGLILIILLMYAACGCAAPTAAKTKTGEEIHHSLVVNYAAVNDTYFGGRLPRDILITYTSDENLPIGQTHYTPLTIFVNAYYDRSESEALLTEDHEICHVWVYETGDEFEDHGPRWMACMHRLADNGAFDDLW